MKILAKFVKKQKENSIRLLKIEGEISQFQLQLIQDKIMRKQDKIEMMLMQFSSQEDFLGPQEQAQLRAQKFRQKQIDFKYEEINKTYLCTPFKSDDENQNFIVHRQIVKDMREAIKPSREILDEYVGMLKSLKLLKIKQLYEERIVTFNETSSDIERDSSGCITPEKELFVPNESFNSMSNIKPQVQSKNVSRMNSPINQSLIKDSYLYTDKTDLLINEFIQSNNVAMPITKIQTNVYQFGSRKVSTKVNNRVLLVKVKGGYMSMANFYYQYDETSHVKLMNQDKCSTTCSLNLNHDNSFLLNAEQLGKILITDTSKASFGTRSPSFYTTHQPDILKKLNMTGSAIDSPKQPIIQTNPLPSSRINLAQNYLSQSVFVETSSNFKGKTSGSAFKKQMAKLSPSRGEQDSDDSMSQDFQLETISSKLDTSFENSVDNSEQSFDSQQQKQQSSIPKQIHLNDQIKRLQKRQKQKK
ncbi:gas2 domain containing protein [Stylonychia lemnae]|uniref:Gas2 domain containing protein n=1 Tax=Stylonychia lemnae TaxID=5949 RepID=A0A078AQG4_STYLE|nr:gas2 domain containing protein [Stylonychia lemnae]|eukprot:CDW84191.1 gas2 domain containing protein [Stylonychia lemnae]